jgi:hypothetical protein
LVEVKGGGKFSDWLKSTAQEAANKRVDIGFFADATYEDGTLVPLVAAIQEFGAPSQNIPPRPFFRQMIQKNQSHWPDDIGKALKATDYDAEKALAVVGEMVAGELREEITAFDGAPLSPKTIARKGSDKQLVDTGTMLKSVTSRVE